MTVKPPARIHLLPAKEAPYVVIVRRKPSKTFHIIRWNVEHDEFEHGSWFTGHIYVYRSDVSFDARWMVYLARGASGATWNGVCLLPYLRTYLEANAPDTWDGGGYWKDSNTLLTYSWKAPTGSLPFRIEPAKGDGTLNSADLHLRMARDGWVRNGNYWGADRRIHGKKGLILRDGDDGWNWRLERCGPPLEAFFRGYMQPGHPYEFRAREFPTLMDQEVEWATFAANGDLVFTRLGCVYRYSRDDLRRGKPGFAADLNGLTREMAGSGK
jgi:hypothetical protein